VWQTRSEVSCHTIPHTGRSADRRTYRFGDVGRRLGEYDELGTLLYGDIRAYQGGNHIGTHLHSPPTYAKSPRIACHHRASQPVAWGTQRRYRWYSTLLRTVRVRSRYGFRPRAVSDQVHYKALYNRESACVESDRKPRRAGRERYSPRRNTMSSYGLSRVRRRW
jgi:hypothetical protein